MQFTRRHWTGSRAYAAAQCAFPCPAPLSRQNRGISGHRVLSVLTCLTLVVVVTAFPSGVAAHAENTANDGGREWPVSAVIATGLAMAGVLYARGTAAIWSRAGWGQGVPAWRASAYFAGLIVLGLALLSPLDRLSGELFAAHMVQHVLLMLAAAPLLVLGTPLAPMMLALPSTWRTRIGRALRSRPVRSFAAPLTHSFVVGVIGIAALWLWHMPSLYEAALRHDLAHAVEHASFLGAAALFWGIVFPAGRRTRLGAALLLVFVTMLQSGGLGALIVFARAPLYASHAESATRWGLTPLQDQQLAGTIMWVPMGVIYLLTALWLVGSWLRTMERTTPAHERGPGDAVAILRGREGGIV